MKTDHRSTARNADLRLRIVVGCIGVALALASIALTRAVRAAQTESAPTAVSAQAGAPNALREALVATSAAARDAVERAMPNQQGALRYLAYVALAQRRVLADSAAQSAAESAVSPRTNEAAVAALWHVSARITEELLPGTTLMTPRNAAIAPPSPVAERVARDVLERAATDNFTLPFDGLVPQGQWMSQLDPPRPPVMPRLGEMRTYYIARGSAVRPPAPPALDSLAFRRDLDELKTIAATRSDAQLATAKFWEMTTGSLVAGYWQQVAIGLAQKYRAAPLFAARAISAALLGALDANIACHDAKYVYWMPRPSQVDPSLKPVVALPNHPSYPSNHGCLSGAAAIVLGQFYPAERADLEAQAVAAAESRLYGGIHYRFDADAGLAIGRAVAEQVALREWAAETAAPVDVQRLSRRAP